MIANSLKTLASSQLLVAVLLLVALATAPSPAAETIAPDRNISVVQAEPQTPEWKVLWDKARNLAHQKQYPEAAKFYAELYQRKPNIEEAAWEYCKVLMRLEKFGAVEKIIDGLLEKNPRRSDYLLAGAFIALQKENYRRAIDFYGRVFEKEPVGEHSEAALEGLAKSLRLNDQKQLSFVLYEQLLLRRPEDRLLILQLARDAYELGFMAKAAALYSRLLLNSDVADQTVLEAADIFEAAGNKKKSSGLWNKYLATHPHYLPFHRKLADYYRETENFTAALNHLTYLIENTVNNDDLLLEAGQLCLHDLNRPDKALKYYERYRQQNPEDQRVMTILSDIQSTMANDFLAIVENDGAAQLWRDLVEVAPNRQAIYLDMAGKLEEQGKIPEVIEILTIIHDNSPDNDQVALRLGRWLYFLHQYDRVLDILDSVVGHKPSKDFYLLKGNAEKKLGREMAAFSSLTAALRLDPRDTGLRITCIDLAGRTGMIDRMVALFNEGVRLHDDHLPYDLVASELDALSYNFLFAEYAKTHRLAVERFATNGEVLAKLTVHLAKTMRRSGDPRRGEQLLRELLNGEQLIVEVLFALAGDAIDDRNFGAAEVWQTALQQRVAKQKNTFSSGATDVRLLLLELRALKVKGDYGEALSLLHDFTKKSGEITEDDIGASLLFRLKKEQCVLNYYNGHYRQVLEVTQQLLDEVDFDAELLTLRQMINDDSGKKGGDRLITSRLNIDGQPVISRLIAVAEKEIEYKAYDAAEKHLKTVIGVLPGSTVGNALRARSMAEQGQLGKADTLYAQLAESFPRENYFVRKMVGIAVRQGRYDQALALLARRGVSPDKRTRESSSQPKEDTIEEQLLLARLLWGDKQQDKSLQVYKELLDPPVVDLLVEQFRKKQINYTDLTREQSFWSSTLLLLQSEPEIIGELMEPQFLIKNRGSEAGKLVAQYFDLYSWQRLITTEYMARTATYNRNYRYAEQSYKRLLEEEDSTEGMLDLATIYSRTGEYRKEAQVYEVIQDSGTSTPQLENSIERTAFQLSPQNSIDGSYFEMSGRDDYINIKKSSVGTSFWFTPALDRDISFLYANNRYESMHGNGKTGSNTILGGATIDFAKRYELKFGGGMEMLNGDGDMEFLYDMEVSGQLDDYVDGYLLFEKKPVYDTVAAIQDHIMFYAIATGLNCETSRGIALGGGVRHRNFSDGNAQNQFNAYSSYTIFGEALQLALRYDYLYIQSEDGNDPEVIRIVEPLYWSPAFYYEHQLSVRFQHDFLGYEQGTKQGVSYYALDGAVGYEDDQTLSFTGLFDIFLEISPHFLLKGNFTLSNSDQYEETGLSLSLHYRW